MSNLPIIIRIPDTTDPMKEEYLMSMVMKLRKKSMEKARNTIQKMMLKCSRLLAPFFRVAASRDIRLLKRRSLMNLRVAKKTVQPIM